MGAISLGKSINEWNATSWCDDLLCYGAASTCDDTKQGQTLYTVSEPVPGAPHPCSDALVAIIETTQPLLIPPP